MLVEMFPFPVFMWLFVPQRTFAICRGMLYIVYVSFVHFFLLELFPFDDSAKILLFKTTQT